MRTSRKNLWVWLLATGLGAAIWVASPFVTGRREPWDAHSPYYILALAGAGFVTGWLEPSRAWRWALAIYAGQCLAVIALTSVRGDDLRLFVPLGMIALAMYTLLSLAGAAAGGMLRRLAGRGST